MTDIVAYNKTPLPNVFTSGVIKDGTFDDKMEKVLNRAIAIALMSKYCRTSIVEFKFIVETLNITSTLPKMGGVYAEAYGGSSNHFQDVYDGKVDMDVNADHVYRSLVVTSIMMASPMELLNSNNVISVNVLAPTDKEKLPIINPSMYTITIDTDPINMSMEVKAVMDKYKNDD